VPASAPSSAAPRRRLAKAARRAQLLAAAEAVFGEHGFHGATMELVAVRAGVTRSLLYEHFSSLDDLYLETVRAARAELDARFVDASILNEGSPRDQLRAGLRAYFRFVAEHGRSWDVLSGSVALPPGPLGDVTAELRFRTADQIAALFNLAVPGHPIDDVRAYAHAVSGAGEQLARWWRKNPGVPIETVVDHAMQVCWSGIGVLAAP
jgi:AcrR family transcriptional regulator